MDNNCVITFDKSELENCSVHGVSQYQTLALVFYLTTAIKGGFIYINDPRQRSTHRRSQNDVTELFVVILLKCESAFSCDCLMCLY